MAVIFVKLIIINFVSLLLIAVTVVTTIKLQKFKIIMFKVTIKYQVINFMYKPLAIIIKFNYWKLNAAATTIIINYFEQEQVNLIFMTKQKIENLKKVEIIDIYLYFVKYFKEFSCY